VLTKVVCGIIALTISVGVLSSLAAQEPTPKLPTSGLFIADIDYSTGKVTAVHISQSLGSAKLDASVVDTLRKWRFKPRTIRRVKIPVTLTLTGAKF
jgi:hypothetical protein